jgi:hypothetical protein
MTRRAGTLALVVSALALAAPALGNGTDAMRCEAVAMRKDAQRYDCLGRCERRHAPRADRPSAEAGLTECRQDCEARYAAAMEQLDGREICTPAMPEPDPNRCQSRLLRIGASRLVCKSQCGARDGGGAECTTTCDAQCAKAVDRAMAKDFCNGHRTGEDVCLSHPGAP